MARCASSSPSTRLSQGTLLLMLASVCGMSVRSSWPTWREHGVTVHGGSRAVFQIEPATKAREPRFDATTAMHELLLSRRTVNDFETELPIDWEASLQRAVKAATFAPNHKRTEPWRFHLLGPEAIRRVCELNAELVSASKGEAAGAKKLERWLAMPGWIVVTKRASSLNDPTSLAREDYAACCCAVQNLCLSLHADGIGTKWTTGPVNFDDRFNEAVGMSANEYTVGTIWFGKAARTPEAPAKRLTVDDVFCRHE